jgi:hypothetical protein
MVYEAISTAFPELGRLWEDGNLDFDVLARGET